MGYNGSNRKSIADRQQGFSKSANRTAERIVYGPRSFRNALFRILITAGSVSSSPRHKKQKSSSSAKDNDFNGPATGALVEQKLYKCECGKISYQSVDHPYCSSCGRWLSEDRIITKDEAEASMKSGCLSVFLIPLFIGITLCLIL